MYEAHNNWTFLFCGTRVSICKCSKKGSRKSVWENRLKPFSLKFNLISNGFFPHHTHTHNLAHKNSDSINKHWNHILYECISSKTFPGDFIYLLENAHTSHWMGYVCYIWGVSMVVAAVVHAIHTGIRVITFSSSVILSVGIFTYAFLATGSHSDSAWSGYFVWEKWRHGSLI